MCFCFGSNSTILYHYGRNESNLKNCTTSVQKIITDKERMMVFEGAFCFIIPYRLTVSVLS